MEPWIIKFRNKTMKEKIFLLCSYNEAMDSPLASKIERPYWNDVDIYINNAFKYGGYVILELLNNEEVYITKIRMYSNPGQFRVVATTNDPDQKKRLLEWWEPGEESFRGKVRFGDDEWDSRTSSSDLSIVKSIFLDFYENGKLSSEEFKNFRSTWDPKP